MRSMSRKQATMKNLTNVLAAIVALAAFSCTQKGNEPPGTSTKTCGICHSLPPTDAGHLFHVGTKHYKCSYCHAGYEVDTVAGVYTVNAQTHQNGDTDVVFTAPWSGDSASYDIVSKKCSNVYCHGGIYQGTNATVLWVGGTPINGRCYACHDSAGFANYHYGHGRIPNYTPPNAHGGEIQDCFRCHGDSLGDTAYSVSKHRVDPVKHIDGVYDGGTCRNCHPNPNGWATWEDYQTLNPDATPYGN